jgi:hypothetical protein
VYNIVERAYPRQLSSNHIAEFVFEENIRRGWVSKQDSMYSIKNECSRQGLRNGTDYVFLNPAATNEKFDSIQIYFEDASYVTYMTMWWECLDHSK